MANARSLARLQTKTGKSPAYWYYFSHVSPMPDGVMWGGREARSWGAYHGSELVYVFNAFPLQDWAWRPMDLKLGDMVSSTWVQFVKTGSPNGPGLPEWPAFALAENRVMNFGDTAAVRPAPFRAETDFIDEWATMQRERR